MSQPVHRGNHDRAASRLLALALLASIAITGCVSQDDSGQPQDSWSKGMSAISAFDPRPGGFSWTMVPRFKGVPQELTAYTYERVNPSEYHVEFDVCPTNKGNGLTLLDYEWTVDGQAVTGMAEARSCQWIHRFQRLGTHSVSVTIREQASTSSARSMTYSKNITLKDYLIVALGDSYGAGEGAPDKPHPTSPEWSDKRCHRSLWSWPAQVARQLELDDPHSSVTFLSLACSGANIARVSWEDNIPLIMWDKSGKKQGSGLLGPYIGKEAPPEPWVPYVSFEQPGSYLPPQVEQLERLVGDRQIDALLLSAGGNDIGFADAVTHCILYRDCTLMTEESEFAGELLRENTQELANALDDSYVSLAETLVQRFPGRIRNVFLAEYPDATRHGPGDNDTCDSMLYINEALNGIRGEEITDLRALVYERLLGIMQQAVHTQVEQGRPWLYVGGISLESRPHGICTGPDVRWVNNFEDSMARQGPPDETKTSGVLHPNYEGQALYKRHVLAAVRATLPAFTLDGTLLKAFNSATVYVVYNGARFALPDASYFSRMGLDPATLREVPAATLESFPTIPKDGTFLRAVETEVDATTYLVVHGKRFAVRSEDWYREWGVTPGNVFSVPRDSLLQIPLDGRDAAFVSQEVSRRMVAGEAYLVSLTLRNTGQETWRAGEPIALGARFPSDNQTWGVNRVFLNEDVAPGATTTLRFEVTAPMAVGIHSFQWQMVQGSAADSTWFGDFTPVIPIEVRGPTTGWDALFVSQSVPPHMVAGQKYVVTVTMKNVGGTTWGPHTVLAPQASVTTPPWGVTGAVLPEPVSPGATATLHFEVTAPSVPGTYNFQWKLLEGGMLWFGDASPATPVEVRAATPGRDAVFVSQSVPARMLAGQRYTVSITMKNAGSTTWERRSALGSQLPQDNVRWGLRSTSVRRDVRPGQTETFTFDVTPPSTPGIYAFQWRMFEQEGAWFGDATPPTFIRVRGPTQGQDAAFVAQVVPTEMMGGHKYTVSISMKNTGSTVWTPAMGLGSQPPGAEGVWGITRVYVPRKVQPGQTATFLFEVRPPTTRGLFNFEWRMLEEGGAWFGDVTPRTTIRVGAPGEHAIPPWARSWIHRRWPPPGRSGSTP